jgi:hypothetical protein
MIVRDRNQKLHYIAEGSLRVYAAYYEAVVGAYVRMIESDEVGVVHPYGLPTSCQSLADMLRAGGYQPFVRDDEDGLMVEAVEDWCDWCDAIEERLDDDAPAGAVAEALLGRAMDRASSARAARSDA